MRSPSKLQKIPSTKEDIFKIIEQGSAWTESLQIEFKREPTGYDESNPLNLSKEAKKDIVKEVVALANLHGGLLIIGIDESDDKPPRAKNLRLLSKSGELADRLGRVIFDCIDPPLYGIECNSIRCAHEDEGVIIIEIPSSHTGPHRSTLDRHVYRRNGTESRPINSMAEIHQLTLLYQKLENQIESNFESCRNVFNNSFKPPNVIAWGGRLAIRVTAVPLTPVTINLDNSTLPTLPALIVRTDEASDRLPESQPFEWTPILRGVRGTAKDAQFHESFHMQENGCLQYTLHVTSQHTGPTIHFVWLMKCIASLAKEVFSFRHQHNIHFVDYGIEYELYPNNTISELGLARLGTKSVSRDTWHNQSYKNLLSSSHGITFPKLEIKKSTTLHDIANAWNRDFWNHIGSEPPFIVTDLYQEFKED